MEGDYYGSKTNGARPSSSNKKRRHSVSATKNRGAEPSNHVKDYSFDSSEFEESQQSKPYVPLHMSTREEKTVYEHINNPNFIPRHLNSRTTAGLTGRAYTTREENKTNSTFAPVQSVSYRPTSRHTDIVYTCLKTMDYTNQEHETRKRPQYSNAHRQNRKRPTTEPAFDRSRKLNTIEVAGFKVNHGTRVEVNPSEYERRRGQKQPEQSHNICMTVHASRHNIDNPSNLGRNVPVWPL
jgi:hypothetical protein